jgi:geranylgeranyl pyrophosphate synthase
VVKHAGVEYALERAHEYAQSAKAALGPFPGSADKDTLLLVADFVVDRDR